LIALIALVQGVPQSKPRDANDFLDWHRFHSTANTTVLVQKYGTRNLLSVYVRGTWIRANGNAISIYRVQLVLHDPNMDLSCLIWYASVAWYCRIKRLPETRTYKLAFTPIILIHHASIFFQVYCSHFSHLLYGAMVFVI